MLGQYRGRAVAIKKCMAKVARDQKELSKETKEPLVPEGAVVEIMKHCAQLRHPNLVLFMGAFLDVGESWVDPLQNEGSQC
jgi:hypothetical protein